jgi:DNA-binding NarL/FixJ family response regulator
MIRVFIADDHAIVRHGLKQLIDNEPGMQVIGEAENGRQVLQADISNWDILVLDLSLPRVNGLEVLRQMRDNHPKLPILILSMYPEEQYAVRLIREGANGYVGKDQTPERVLEAIRKVASGGTVISPDVAAQLVLMGSEPPHDRLTAREYQVFTLIFQGKIVGEIAAELNLTSSTVSNHLAKIKEKLGVHSTAEVVQYAFRSGLTR